MTANSEILTATQFTLGFFDQQFHPATPTEIQHLNAKEINDGSTVLGASTRELIAYDPIQGCMIAASEVFGMGKDEPGAEITDGHFVILEWLDREEDCMIDMDTGQVWETGPCDEEVEVDLSCDPDKHQRIISALAALADKCLEVG